MSPISKALVSWSSWTCCKKHPDGDHGCYSAPSIGMEGDGDDDDDDDDDGDYDYAPAASIEDDDDHDNGYDSTLAHKWMVDY